MAIRKLLEVRSLFQKDAEYSRKMQKDVCEGHISEYETSFLKGDVTTL